MNSKLRGAGLEDISTLVALMTEFYGEAGYPLSLDAASSAFTSLLMNSEWGRIWLIEVDAEPVGYVVLTLGFSMEYGGKRGFIDDFFVRPTLRGRGLGREALKQVRSHCRESGVRALLVETGPENHPARGVYARAGFKDSGRVLLSQSLVAAIHEV